MLLLSATAPTSCGGHLARAPQDSSRLLLLGALLLCKQGEGGPPACGGTRSSCPGGPAPGLTAPRRQLFCIWLSLWAGASSSWRPHLASQNTLRQAAQTPVCARACVNVCGRVVQPNTAALGGGVPCGLPPAVALVQCFPSLRAAPGCACCFWQGGPGRVGDTCCLSP